MKMSSVIRAFEVCLKEKATTAESLTSLSCADDIPMDVFACSGLSHEMMRAVMVGLYA
jgi:hypothetical protein